MSLFTQKGSLHPLGKAGHLMLALVLFCVTLFQGMVFCLCNTAHPTTCDNDATHACVCEAVHSQCQSADEAHAHRDVLHHRCEHVYLDSVPPAEYAQRERIRVLIALLTCALYTENQSSTACLHARTDATSGLPRPLLAPMPRLLQSPSQRLC